MPLCTGAESFGQAAFGEGPGRVWLTNVQCTGEEEELINCAVNSSDTNSCTHAQDAGIRCVNGTYILYIDWPLAFGAWPNELQ